MAAAAAAAAGLDAHDARAAEKEMKREMYEGALLTKHKGATGSLISWNVEFGYLEGICRGFRKGFLRDFEYRQLTQCESLDDFKLAFSDTDYMNVLQSTNKLSPNLITEKCRAKFAAEFNFMRNQATGQLSSFLEYITYEHLITSITFIIGALTKGADPAVVLEKCHPLGRSPHLKSVLSFESFADGGDSLMELYSTVLVDTPVARYFETYFKNEIRKEMPGEEIQRVFNEVEVYIITEMLRKHWLEDFYAYTQSLGGETAEQMKELLEFEADRRAMEITVNSFHNRLNAAQNRASERQALYCNFGKLHPKATLMDFQRVGDENDEKAFDEAFRDAIEPYPEYIKAWNQSKESGRSFTDCLKMLEVKKCVRAFEGQSHFAVFYAFVKLKEIELANIKLLTAVIERKRVLAGSSGMPAAGSPNNPMNWYIKTI